jgi:hypothetical protein
MIKQLFENAVNQERFRLPILATELASHEPFTSYSEYFEGEFDRSIANFLMRGIIRFVFLIEPVNRNITSTKFEVRWSLNFERHFDFGRSDDPRWCGFDDCMEIAISKMDKLRELCGDEELSNLIVLFNNKSIIPYEIALDYDSLSNEHIHRLSNISWYFTDLASVTLNLRRYISENCGDYSGILKKALDDKIKVKTYLTDRAQTGLYQTNREKRWECHPNSVQFAFRRECWEIEHKLIEQIFYFENFPENIRDEAIRERILGDYIGTARCPITMVPLSFDDLRRELETPEHGRATVQVGHLNPLKTFSREKDGGGHVAENVSWISHHGNRIQGDLSLEETRNMIREIYGRYTEFLDKIHFKS